MIGTRKLQCATADRARMTALEAALARAQTEVTAQGERLRLEVQGLRDRVLRVERQIRALQDRPAPAKAY